MQRFRNVFKFIFGLFFLTFFTIFLCSVKTVDRRAVKDIEVHYINTNLYPDITKEDIILEVKLFLSTQDSVKDINTSVLEDLIVQYKYIKQAEVYLDLKGVLNIDLNFRQPFLSMLRDNKVYYFDDEGVELLNLINSHQTLLVLSGDWSESRLLESLDLLHKIYKHPILNKLIGGIYFDKKKGYVLSAKACDLGINLGFKPGIREDKVNMIEAFYNLLLEELGCDYCNAINIMYDKQIICIN